MAKDRAHDRNRVIDLTATRILKEITGKTRPVEASSSHKHEDEALDIHKPKPKLIAGPGWMGENE